MKKLLAAFLVMCMVLALTGCGETDSNNDSSYYDEYDTYQYEESSSPARIPDYVLEDALCGCVYRMNPFSISVEELVRKAVSGVSATYYDGEEMVANGICTEEDFTATADKEHVYYAIVSGDVMQNPDVPYMTRYEDEALTAVMVFDDNQNLTSYDIRVSETLRICATLIMVQ